MVHICLSAQEIINPVHPADALIIVGTSKGFQDHFAWVCKDILKLLLEGSGSLESQPEKKAKTISEEQSLLEAVLPSLQPSQDSGVSTECWLKRPTSEKPLRVVLAVLPVSASRHNAPGQPYAVTSLLKKSLRTKEVSAVACLCESPAYIMSTTCAIARVGGAMMYTRKTGSGAAPAKGLDLMETSIPSVNAVRVAFPFAIDKTTQEELANLCLGIQFTRRLVDAPCNELHTTAFTDQALEAIKKMEHVTWEVIKGQELQAKGYGGLWGVGKAAENPPALVTLKYNPPGSKGKKSIVMVGKGIVFDTGGLQIKTKAGMPGMKRDMGGAAAILSAFVSAIDSGVVKNHPLHAVLCLAENAVASNATRPDDILTLYSGKTVEINNTDAEGRLVLGDGVSSAVKHLDPSVIIDMATLTGAQGVATGKYFGALYTNDEELEKIAVQAGRESGDLCHPMPYAPEFFRPEFSSAVADMKNSVADRANAQVSCAGQFIGNQIADFLESGGKWMHFDMGYNSYDRKDERATGYGVALLHSIIRKIDQMPL